MYFHHLQLPKEILISSDNIHSPALMSTPLFHNVQSNFHMKLGDIYGQSGMPSSVSIPCVSSLPL